MDPRAAAGSTAGFASRATALVRALMPSSRRSSLTHAGLPAQSEVSICDGALNRLALYQRPVSVALLDDDIDFLGMLLMTLPKNWNIEAFSNPHACLKYLQQESAQWDADFCAHQSIVEKWHAGTPLIPQILRYWQESRDRYKLTRVCVVDYQMPQIDGLQTLGELRGWWPGHRVMMTGSVENLAPTAFKAELIDEFVPKQTTNFRSRLVAAIEALREKPDCRYSQIWHSTLKPAQVEILRDKSNSDDLYCFVATNFVEYMVIGDPAGAGAGGGVMLGLPGWQVQLLRHGRPVGALIGLALITAVAAAAMLGPRLAVVPVFAAGVLALFVLRAWSRARRERLIREAPMPRYLKRKLVEHYPQLTPRDAELVERGLRQFFLACYRSGGRFVAMPSKAVDAMWHEYILNTKAYRDWCALALGRFLHHTPAEVLGANPTHNDGLRRAWLWSCKEESINPRQPLRLPLLFALDTKFGIEGGFRYVPDCGKPRRADEGGGGSYVHCGAEFGDASSGSAGDADGFGGSDASPGDGGGDAGGDGGGGCGGGD
uniref:Uncharacterized protein n=1 Tax=uncultured Pseudomonadota bacterium TaxID=153809 RepID=B7T9X2_9PROT|nr:hypothetical protein [uncultured proteobacterium]